MKVFSSKEKLHQQIGRFKADQKKIGFVPTMGALHEGHLSLVRRGFEDNAIMVVSVFVNPTQFNNEQDLLKYPRTLEADVALLQSISKDKIIVYAPSVADVYGNDVASTSFSFDGLEFEMEGKFRAGHFDGVGTIVKRLFEIIQPDFAYFGEKDFQQLQIVRKLTENYNIPVKVVGCKIHRAPSGLAMSSRNARLKPEYKNAAPFIYHTLKIARQMFKSKSVAKVSEWVKAQFENHQLLDLEYFNIADEKTLKPFQRKSKHKKYRAFIAVFADDIRLIDNIALN